MDYKGGYMKCKCDWCNKESKYKGYCSRHYQQINKYGELKHTRYDKHHFIIDGNVAKSYMYDEHGEVREVMIIDVEDVERVRNYKWHMKYNGNKHIEGKIDGKVVQLHRFIMQEYDEEVYIDHINRNPLDNRKSNLRRCRRSENAKNRTKNANNKVGHKNISKTTSGDKYRVCINKDGKQYYLGVYSTLDEAVEVRDRKLKELHGEFASQG